jgi:hypothetical protein
MLRAGSSSTGDSDRASSSPTVREQTPTASSSPPPDAPQLAWLLLGISSRARPPLLPALYKHWFGHPNKEHILLERVACPCDEKATKQTPMLFSLFLSQDFYDMDNHLAC